MDTLRCRAYARHRLRQQTREVGDMEEKVVAAHQQLNAINKENRRCTKEWDCILPLNRLIPCCFILSPSLLPVAVTTDRIEEVKCYSYYLINIWDSFVICLWYLVSLQMNNNHSFVESIVSGYEGSHKCSTMKSIEIAVNHKYIGECVWIPLRHAGTWKMRVLVSGPSLRAVGRWRHSWMLSWGNTGVSLLWWYQLFRLFFYLQYYIGLRLVMKVTCSLFECLH